jgi:hypothetical protein
MRITSGLQYFHGHVGESGVGTIPLLVRKKIKILKVRTKIVTNSAYSCTILRLGPHHGRRRFFFKNSGKTAKKENRKKSDNGKTAKTANGKLKKIYK